VILLRDPAAAVTGAVTGTGTGAVTGAATGAVTAAVTGAGAGASGGPEVHLLRRRASMAFAAGAYAYPGGGVDPRDERPIAGWAGPSAAAWAGRLGLESAAEARAVVCAAARETFEEAGVLLAGPDPQTVVADPATPEWEADRAALAAHRLGFAELLERRGLVLRTDLLAAWARWITPEFEERRYDTWFFVAALPAGQRARDLSGEADRADWLPVADAVGGYDRGELSMLPPTVATLRALLPYPSVAATLTAAGTRDLTPVQARVTADPAGGVTVRWPGHEEFTLCFPGPDREKGDGDG
jgi:8-oxo-dGTP pyrophosphatase MutT (NUDIX family)